MCRRWRTISFKTTTQLKSNVFMAMLRFDRDVWLSIDKLNMGHTDTQYLFNTVPPTSNKCLMSRPHPQYVVQSKVNI